MPTSKPILDLAKIGFPSDKLSFGALRKLFPDLIDASPDVTFFCLPKRAPDFHVANLTNLLEGEREIAMIAFNAALGHTWDHPDEIAEDEIKQQLTEDYVRYGVASGEQHAVQLIRDIEASAVEQARHHVQSR